MNPNSGLNAAGLKQNNRTLLLQQLQLHPRSRADLARLTGLTRAAITNIVDQLSSEGVILEGQRQEGGSGRPSVNLELNPEAYHAVGLCLKRDYMHMGIVDLCGNILYNHREPIDNLPDDPQDAVAAVIGRIHRMLAQHPAPGRLLGIGISSPGPLDRTTGYILKPPNFARFSNTPIAPLLASQFQCTALLENDIMALALAENVYGIRGKYANFLELVADAGIGGGLIQDGKLSQGMRGLGHISLDIHGPRCQCGNYGCVEIFATISRIVEWARTPDPSLRDWSIIVDRAYSREPAAMHVLEKEAGYLAAAITTAANIVDFDAVVLSGSLAYRSRLLSEQIQGLVNQRTFNSNERTVEVIASQLPEHYYILSGATLIFSHWMEHSC